MVLLTATPMYNEVAELEWIVNLMRWNQNMAPMKNSRWLNGKTGDWLAPISRSK